MHTQRGREVRALIFLTQLTAQLAQKRVAYTESFLHQIRREVEDA